MELRLSSQPTPSPPERGVDLLFFVGDSDDCIRIGAAKIVIHRRSRP